MKSYEELWKKGENDSKKKNKKKIIHKYERKIKRANKKGNMKKKGNNINFFKL
jgi:hypothetical protein